MKTFAQQLVSWRRKRGLTHVQAAAELGLPHRTYESYEQGRYEPRTAFARNIIIKIIKKPLDTPTRHA